MTPIEEHFSLLDTSEEDEIEIYNNNHDSVDGISKPLDALEYEIQIHEIEKLIPDVLKVLTEDDHGILVKNIFQLLHEKKFPLKNSAFRLCADVVQWFTLKDTRCMRYSDETLQLFWLGKNDFILKTCNIKSLEIHKTKENLPRAKLYP